MFCFVHTNKYLLKDVFLLGHDPQLEVSRTPLNQLHNFLVGFVRHWNGVDGQYSVSVLQTGSSSRTPFEHVLHKNCVHRLLQSPNRSMPLAVLTNEKSCVNGVNITQLCNNKKFINFMPRKSKQNKQSYSLISGT